MIWILGAFVVWTLGGFAVAVVIGKAINNADREIESRFDVQSTELRSVS